MDVTLSKICGGLATFISIILAKYLIYGPCIFNLVDFMVGAMLGAIAFFMTPAVEKFAMRRLETAGMNYTVNQILSGLADTSRRLTTRLDKPVHVSYTVSLNIDLRVVAAVVLTIFAIAAIIIATWFYYTICTTSTTC